VGGRREGVPCSRGLGEGNRTVEVGMVEEVKLQLGEMRSAD
jgi:hypothetical protein